MAGTCSGGAVPPECIPGAKWPPNDPLFFLHHAVRWFLPLFSLTLLTRAMQMIDKIWYDWQKKSPKNVYAFGGGSVQASTSYAIFEEFPTGLPPDLNVSVLDRIGKPVYTIMTPVLPPSVQQRDAR